MWWEIVVGVIGNPFNVIQYIKINHTLGRRALIAGAVEYATKEVVRMGELSWQHAKLVFEAVRTGSQKRVDKAASWQTGRV